jgi:hypothetical protein
MVVVAVMVGGKEGRGCAVHGVQIVFVCSNVFVRTYIYMYMCVCVYILLRILCMCFSVAYEDPRALPDGFRCCWCWR